MPTKGKVLITGYGGFTGKLLAEKLTDLNYKVYGLVINGPINSNQFKVDITDYPSLSKIIKTIKPNFIVHLAGVANVAQNDDDLFYKVNLFGTLNILQALDEAQLQPQKIIVAGSAYIYGNCLTTIIDENVSPKPINHYGNSKLAMENMVSTWFERFPIIITRPFNYTGPGQELSYLIPKIVKFFREKKPFIELGNTSVTRDISDVDMVIDVYHRLLISDVHSQIFNICSGIGYTIDNIMEMMTQISGHHLEIKSNPDLFRKNEIFSLIGSNQKLSKVIGEIPLIPFKKTLEKMYAHLSAASC